MASHRTPAPARRSRRAPRERGQLRVVRHVDRHAPGAFEPARGVERAEEGLLALPAPEGVVEEGAEGDPPLSEPSDELVLPLGVVLDERQGLVRDRHRVAVAAFVRLAVRARHRVEVGAHELGHVPSGGLLVEAPGGVGARVVDDVDRPGGRRDGLGGGSGSPEQGEDQGDRGTCHGLASLTPSRAHLLLRSRSGAPRRLPLFEVTP